MLSTIIYEVNLQILPEIYEKYIDWLLIHIQEMLQFKGFIKASLLKEKALSNVSLEHITIHYKIECLDDLNHYLEEHAIIMREKGLEQFPMGVSASRRSFEVFEVMKK